MREVAELILSFSNESPIIILSAMGKTTNKLLLAGEKAVSCGVTNVDSIEELSFIKELHLRTAKELEVNESVIAKHLDELEQLLNGIAMMKELTPRTKDYLVSFGECMSTRIFAAYMNKIGAKARQMLMESTCPQRCHGLLNQTPVSPFQCVETVFKRLNSGQVFLRQLKRRIG